MFFANVSECAERLPHYYCEIRYHESKSNEFSGCVVDAVAWLKTRKYDPSCVECVDVETDFDGTVIYYLENKHLTYKELYEKAYEEYRSGFLSGTELNAYASEMLTEMCVFNKSVNDVR